MSDDKREMVAVLFDRAAEMIDSRPSGGNTVVQTALTVGVGLARTVAGLARTVAGLVRSLGIKGAEEAIAELVVRKDEDAITDAHVARDDSEIVDAGSSMYEGADSLGRNKDDSESER